MKSLISVLTLFALLSSSTCLAIDESLVREKLHTVYGLYLTPYEAFNMKMENEEKVLLVDIRTRAELKYVGTAGLIDANIPSRFIDTAFGWSDKVSSYRTSHNNHFVADFERLMSKKKMDKETPVILICQSGSRVPRAAETLQEAGFKTVYSQFQGFEGIKAKTGINKGQRLVNGWKNSGLPWSFKLKKEAMYFNFDSSRAQEVD
jgi:rhodanese-related sulfurtransferase